MNKFILLLLLISGIAVAKDNYDPNERIKPVIVREQNGNTINFRVIGAREPQLKIGCVEMSALKNTYTPPDILVGALNCVRKKNYERAVQFVLLANIYSSFDEQRVMDETARDAGYVSFLEIFWQELSNKEKEKFFAAAEKILTKDLSILPSTLAAGMPQYYPNYMILNGLNAFEGDPHTNALNPHFDPSTAKLMTRFWLKDE